MEIIFATAGTSKPVIFVDVEPSLIAEEYTTFAQHEHLGT